jgi:CRP-like cAMP-binding protein
MSDEDWELLAPYISEKSLKKGTIFAPEGKVGKELGMILEGTMRHYYTRDGEERTTYFYFDKDLTGPYLSCLTGKPSQMSFEALTDVQMLVFPYTKLKEAFDQSKQWERFGRLLAEWALNGVEERMAGLLMLGPEERYLQLLASNKQKILERIPQHLIANYLGITPVSLSRIRNRVTKNGTA